VTPSLEPEYDALLARAALPPFGVVAAELRVRFGQRCGWYAPEHPGTEAREAAAWEDALVRGALAVQITAHHGEFAPVARVISRAQRGLFVLDQLAGSVVALDLWSRAAFVLHDTDTLVRGFLDSGSAADAPLFHARVAPLNGACVVLPGVLFHPPDARAAVEAVLVAARERELATDDALDAVLKMEHTFRTLSRIKLAYAYRPEMLPAAKRRQ
jgi:hypothetical protein